MADRRDYVALEWVKGEIDETLKQARYALEAYVETPDDTNRLEFSLSYIHQVHGTLQMVEFFGAALLAEEMEMLNSAIVAGNVPANNDNLAVLMQAIIQLPNYLDQLKQGQHDLPIIILPLLNDLRAARGESLLSETALFSPDLNAAHRLIGEPDYSAFDKAQTSQLIRKLRQMYQLALLGWLKGDDTAGSLDFLAKSVGRVVRLTERSKISALWRVSDAFVAAIKAGLISRSPAVVKILRDIDLGYKNLLNNGLEAVQQFPSESMLKNLLFYLAKLGDTGIERIETIQRQFRLVEALPSAEEVESQRARLSGPDREAVGNVVAALLDELSRLKDALDLLVRTEVKDSSRLEELKSPIQQLCDTMAVIGLGNPKRVLTEQLELINKAQQQPVLNDDGLLMDIAGALLYVEASLSGIVSESNLDVSESVVSKIDVGNAHDAVIREARNGLEQVKDSVVEYIGSHFDYSLLADAPAILSGISGGLQMVPLNNASRVLIAVQKFVQDKLIEEKYRPEWHEMDALADALVGVEYYLERISRDGSTSSHEILERAAQSLEKLGIDVLLSKKANETAARADKLLSEDSSLEGSAAESALTDQIIESPISEDLSTITAGSEPENLDDSESYEIDFSAEDTTGEAEPDWSIDASADNNSEFETTIDIGEEDTLSDEPWDEMSDVDLPESSLSETSIFNQQDFAEAAEFVAEQSSAMLAETAVIPPTPSSENEAVSSDDDLIDDEILEIFIEEAEEVLETINEFFPKYKVDTTDEASLTEFRRAFHTLKGSGRMVGATLIGETAWSVENMLNRLIDGTIMMSDDLLKIVEEVTAEVPALVKAFEAKVQPDARRADALAEIANALSRGEIANWASAEITNLEDQIIEADVQSGEELEVDPNVSFELDGTASDDNDDNLLSIFQNELESHLEFIETYLADSPLGRKLPDALQRALHTIKGSAHMASMELIADVVMPVEAIVKDMQERADPASDRFVEIIVSMVSLVKQYSQSEPGGSMPAAASEFVEQVNVLRLSLLSTEQNQQGEDISLMSIFFSESMDIVMDAESILEAWRDSGDLAEATTTLIRELDTLAQAAHAVDLIPLSQLSNELRSLYLAAEANPYIIEEKFFSLAYDGHESLISMMDRLAAGQSIRTDALFSERLQQLYDLYAIPYEVRAPLMANELNPSYEKTHDPASAEHSTAAQEIVVEDSLSANSERYEVEGDSELVEIFLEEANDILENIQQSLENWITDPKNTIEVEALQRDLHTLKGGARMAEVTPLGDLAHELEFLYEGLAQGQYESSAALVNLLQQCHDRLAIMVGDIESSMTCMSAPDLVDAISLFRKNPGAPAAPIVLKSVKSDVAQEAEFKEISATVPDSKESTPALTPNNLTASESGADTDKDDVESFEEGKVTVTLPDLPDDLDFDILEIFIDEAGELLNELENAVEEWRSESSNEAHADEMKRVLHTLKGGARLARLKELGDDSHNFESFVVKAQQNKIPLNDIFFNEVLKRQDKLVQSIEAYHSLLQQQGTEGGGFGPSVIQMVSDLDEDEINELAAKNEAESFVVVEKETELVRDKGPLNLPAPVANDDSEDASANVLPFKAKAADKKASATTRRAQPQETVKVAANLLEGLVNLAGETSISRSRLEQEVSDFGFTLGDMDQTIDRLRDHVRRLDMETEAQIIFRQERAEETNYEDFDPLEMDRYSQIQQLSRSLMEATYDLQDIKVTLTDKTRDAETILLQQSRINTELQEGLMRTRMVPFNRLLPRLRRIVRQVAGELGKQVDFVVGNAEGEVDRTVLERMISPLEHLLRNAVDHGIEMPDGRSNAGKDLKGTVKLDLSREGGDIVLRLEDDGKGIDVSKIREKAVERGLMQTDSDLNDSEIMQFILEADFSTAEKITQISGRGVGMDVVNSEVKQLGGSIFIDSLMGKGSVFTIRLPFTVSVNRALMVNILDDLYALPLTSIEGIVRVTPKQLAEYYQPDAPLFEYGDSRYRLEYMGALLHTGARPNANTMDNNIPLVLVRGSDERHSMALHVDQLMGSREIVVKTLGAQFSKIPGVSGATILGDGSVVVILDLSALIRSELVIEHSGSGILPDYSDLDRKKEGPSKVMVCDDSVTVRKVTSRLLNRNGIDVMVAKHGGDAITQMIDEIPDLILLDIEMPHMDGFEVASRVRNDDRLKHIPIIMITSRTGSKHRERAISIGVNEYMGKPFQEGPLLETIERLLEESKG